MSKITTEKEIRFNFPEFDELTQENHEARQKVAYVAVEAIVNELYDVMKWLTDNYDCRYQFHEDDERQYFGGKFPAITITAAWQKITPSGSNTNQNQNP